MNLKTILIAVSIILTGWLAPVVNAGFIHYELDWGTTLGSRPDCFVFNFDPNDTGIGIYTLYNDPDTQLFMFKLVDHSVSDPVVMAEIPGRCLDLNGSGGPDGTFHLCWRDEDGCLWYTRFQNDSIIDPVCLDTAGSVASDTPRIDVDSHNDVHIGFPGGEGDIIYIHSDGIEFHAAERIVITPDDPKILWMDLAVAGTGTVHFICTTPDKQLMLWSHDGTEFSIPEPVPGAAPGYSAGKKPWVLVDTGGTLYMFYHAVHTRASGMRNYQFYYQSGNRETGFSTPDRINSDYAYSEWVEPRIGPEGEIHLIGIRGYDRKYPPYDHKWMGIHYLWNGLSFAPTTIRRTLDDYPFEGNSAICFDIDMEGNIARLAKNDTSIGLAIHKKILPEAPFLFITVTPYEYWNLNYKDIISSHLSIYNPGPEPLVADLYLVLTYHIPYRSTQTSMGGRFFFTDHPHFPSFTEDLYSFPVVLPVGIWYQNIPLVDIDMSMLGPDGFADCSGSFYAGLVEPETGQLIGNLTSAMYFYDMNDGY